MKPDSVISVATISLVAGIAGGVAGAYVFGLAWNPLLLPPGATYCATDGSQAISGLVADQNGYPKTMMCVNLASGGSGGHTCFLLGAIATMADGSKRPLADVRIGDRVSDGCGGSNTVLALDRTKLGERLMYWINREHFTSAEHPHMRPDRSFGAPDVNAIYDEWGGTHRVIVKGGSIELRRNVGLAEGMVTEMRVGQTLLKETGPVPLISLDICEPLEWPPETPLGNLVVNRSGTYVVDGYVVTGWPDYERWDYARWAPKAAELVVA
jgi:hypothetical protein